MFPFFAVLYGCASDEAVEPARLAVKDNGAVQLIVDGKPFIMLAGELHNSSASSEEYLDSLWPSLRQLNLNTVLAAVTWEQLEPEEGQFDFTLVDAIIDGAEDNGMKAVILWFGSWKNGESSYAPGWVKKDTERFFRVKTSCGKEIETLSPFCRNTMEADARAFRALVGHIRDYDRNRTVIALQPENEVGIFQDMDYSETSVSAYRNGKVPAELISYMQDNLAGLRPELRDAWMVHGCRTNGTWTEVFGDNPLSRSYFTSWHFASYIDEVAAQAKELYPLPVFCNCWIVQASGDLPGVYPNGGPVSRVFDIWKAAAPNVDVLSPDIYLSDFKGISADYKRNDNPLLIPEAVMSSANAFWAFAEHDALCYSPFGIEDGAGNFQYAKAYEVLGELMPLICEYQGSDRMSGIFRSGDETGCRLAMGNWILDVSYDCDDAYGLVIRTSDTEFIVAGMGFSVKFSSADPSKTGYIGQVWEGGFDPEGVWRPGRLLNGDETYHNARLLVKGRRTLTSERADSYSADHSDEIFVYSPASWNALWSVGIYKVTTYIR